MATVAEGVEYQNTQRAKRENLASDLQDGARPTGKARNDHAAPAPQARWFRRRFRKSQPTTAKIPTTSVTNRYSRKTTITPAMAA
ncbi:MAG: hypothetical protein R2706_15395 [Acidimicrobiales bacterium]